MDSLKKESSKASGNSLKPKLRSSIRSSTAKLNDDKTASSAPKRVKPASGVSKSASLPNVSDKDKSPKPTKRLSVPAKPTKRLSVPAKSLINPLPRSSGIIAPISNPGIKKVANKVQRKDEKPVSDVTKSTSRKKFSILSSVSYWLSQIKISEAVAKHSVSLGFFKLALESGCEPLQRMRDELKSYTGRHDLVKLKEPLKELLIIYNISETIDQLQTNTSSQVPGQSSKSLKEVKHNSSSIARDKKLNPKSLKQSPRALTASKNRDPNIIAGNQQKVSQKPTMQVETQNQEENCVMEKDQVEDLPIREIEVDDKENEVKDFSSSNADLFQDTQQQQETNLIEVN